MLYTVVKEAAKSDERCRSYGFEHGGMLFLETDGVAQDQKFFSRNGELF